MNVENAFTRFYVMFNNILNAFAEFVSAFDSDVIENVEQSIEMLLGVKIDIPFEFVLSEWLTTPIIIVVVILGCVAFLFRCIDAIIPF